MTAVDTEIDNFIRQQRAKLANERHNLNTLEPSNYYKGNAQRRRWGPPVDLDTAKIAEKENYKRTWYELKGKYLEPSSNRKQPEPMLKLSPRGVLDTTALILDVQKEKEREEYQEIWKQLHGGQEPFRRNPINHAPINQDGGGASEPFYPQAGPEFTSPYNERQKEKQDYKRMWQQQHPEGKGYSPAQNIALNEDALDIDQIIREVQKEKQEEEDNIGLLNPIFGGGQPSVAFPGRGVNMEEVADKRGIDTEAYQIRSEQPIAKDVSKFDDSQRNIENKISEAKQEAGDYRKRWEARHDKQASDAERLRLENYAFLVEEDRRLEKSKQLREERKREYNEYLARKRQLKTRERYDLQPEFDESEEFGLLHNLGMEDKKKQQKRVPQSQLNLPGKSFYIDNKQRGFKAAPLREQTDEYKASTLGPNESDAVKLQKIKERNEEYNQYLIAKNEKDKNRFSDRKPPEDSGIYATIPGLRYSTSAHRRELAAERNKEYNDMLHQKNQNRSRRGPDVPFAGPKQGWSTPTYEEMLDQKRALENNYRRANDMAYEGNLHALDTERRIRELQRELTSNPLTFAPAASELVREQKTMLSRLKDIDNDLKNYQDTGIRGPPLEGQGFGTQSLISDPRLDKQKQKEEYKRELLQQMAETAYARKREKDEGQPVTKAPSTHPGPIHVIYGGRETNRKDPAVEAYHTKILDSLHKLDEISPQKHAILARGQGTGNTTNFGGSRLNQNTIPTFKHTMHMDKQDSGILDLGFGPVLEPSRMASLDPPPGLQYQPSTYITALAVPSLNNSVDEAYNFYASHNPLNPLLTGGQGGGDMGGNVPVPSLDLSRVGRDGGPASKVQFRDYRPQEVASVGMAFATDEDRKRGQKQQQSAYREELERQMLEKNMKKIQDKKAQERYDIKMEEEAKNYDPFGKGGGGAPMRDQEGNVITDLRQMRHDNTYRENKFPQVGHQGDNVGHAGNTTRAAASYRDDLIGPPPAQKTAEGETSFARGGHGIFGMPKTDAEKMQADKYKIELKRQMEEKRAEEYRKKQIERLEEERQLKIIEEQRIRMQKEFDEEQRKIKEKEEETRRRNEEMIRVAEEKKRESERRKREAEEQRQQDYRERREERERELREQQMEDEDQGRGKSPAIPTLRARQDSNILAMSPPIPAVRTKAVADPLPTFRQEYAAPRTHSADVLNQLAHMRAQLQNERKRVQTMLNEQEDDVEIYDPRTAHRPPPVPVAHSKPDIDVFETAMNRGAVAVRRTPAERANPQAVEDFNALKHKNDSDSRKQFRHLFPDEPVTGEALETQQAALLRQQEERLRNIRDRRAFEAATPQPLNRDTDSSSVQLHSKSAFVDLNGFGHFPDDFEDIPPRNDSARSRRRTRASSSPRIISPASGPGFGSQSSLNIDKLARKNEDRLKKLRDMQGDDLSLYDPEDVLERFMSKQGHNRPPSGNTILEDTWVTAGNGKFNY